MTFASDQLNLAVRLARGGERDQARSLFHQIVQQTPGEAEAWLWLSELADNLDDQVFALDKATQCIDAAHDSHDNLQDRLNTIRGVVSLPPPPQPLSGKAGLNSDECEDAAAEKASQVSALEWAERLVVLDEKHEAVRLLEELVNEDPACEGALMLLCELTPRADEKKRLLERILAINPCNTQAAQQIENINRHAPERRSLLDRIAADPVRNFTRRLFSR